MLRPYYQEFQIRSALLVWSLPKAVQRSSRNGVVSLPDPLGEMPGLDVDGKLQSTVFDSGGAFRPILR